MSEPMIAPTVQISDLAEVTDRAWVSGQVRVMDQSKVTDESWVGGSSLVSGWSVVKEKAMVVGNVQITDRSRVGGSSLLEGQVHIAEDAVVTGNTWIFGSARIKGMARVDGLARIGLNARIFRTDHYITIGPIGSQSVTLTAWRDRDGIGIGDDFTAGLIDEFEQQIINTYGDTQHGLEYAAAIALIRARAASWEPITDKERADVFE